jgi:DNA-binding Lrp family transcriptional regulator
MARRAGSEPTRANRRSTPRPPRVSRAAQLDDIDRKLLELLVEDGRASNRGLAQQVGLTDASVAARIRRLREQGVASVTAVFDYEAAGYRCVAFVFVEVGGRLPRDVGLEVASLPEAHGVSLTFGSADLIVHAITRDRAHLTRLLTEDLVAIDGVRNVTGDVVLETVEFRWALATLPDIREPRLDFPAPVVEIDDLDQRMLAHLVEDGRASNREIARKLGVSDGTVRARIRRLEEAGLMRIVAQTDPVALGQVGAMAHIGVEVEGASARSVVAALRDFPEIAQCALVSGRYDIHVVVATADLAALGTLVAERMRSLRGVGRTTTWPVVEVLAHDHQLVRLLDR